MIRFIPLNEEDTGWKFALFDTILDRFRLIHGEQVWDSLKDVHEACTNSGQHELYKRVVPIIQGGLKSQQAALTKNSSDPPE